MKLPTVVKKILYGIGWFVVFLFVIGLANPVEQDTFEVNSNLSGATVASLEKKDIANSIDRGDIEVEGEEQNQKKEETVEEVVQETVDEEDHEDQEIYYSVIKVVDGDTLSVDMDGKKVTLRLIGIDTPETVDPRKPVECFGVEASNKAKELLTGKSVRIEQDPTQGEFDKYNRLLAYIYLEDELFFNKYMIEEGYAHEYTYNLPYKYQTEFKEAELFAQNNKKGLWAIGVCDGSDDVQVEVVTPEPVEKIPPADTGEYTCSFNAYNCGDFSTHAEAQTVYELCGGVSNDVHRLDRDNDGEACESLP